MIARANVLIVDDDTAVLQALPRTLFLRMQNVNVDTADSATGALQLIRTRVYDAIVSDVKMPEMDGLALLAKIQELHQNTPTLLITGHGDHNLTLQALRGGAYDFIHKPIDRDYFVAALCRAIQTHQLQLQVQEQQQALEEHVKFLETRVQERTQELMETNVAKDELIGIASHELKTPLTCLKGMVQLHHRRLIHTDSQEVATVARIEQSIHRIEVLVNDLLSFSHMETSMFTLHCRRCNIGDLCRSLVDEFLASTNPSPVISIDFADEDIEVNVDAERIGQVILNLLSNAQKYSPANSPIHISLKRQDDKCIIAVHDKGVGISPKLLPHIFERFYRVPGIKAQTGSNVGFGLGLYISQQIVERHGGSIHVESVPGIGSTFSVGLPLPTDSSSVRSNEVESSQQI